MGQQAAETKGASQTALKAVILDRVRVLKKQLRDQQGSDKNRRRSSRRPFPYTQRIAPFQSEFPSESKFQEYACQDISTTGFSFRAEKVPSYSDLVVELGVPENYAYLTAKIVRNAPQPDGSLLIGCQFTGRLNGQPGARPASGRHATSRR